MISRCIDRERHYGSKHGGWGGLLMYHSAKRNWENEVRGRSMETEGA
jgi:hypothetical protein